jgi:IS605 OrfB family transposase
VAPSTGDVGATRPLPDIRRAGLAGDIEDRLRSGLWRLAVAADRQGRGYGRFAVEAVCEELRRRRLHHPARPEATTSDGTNHSGEHLTRYRRRMARVRAELQAKGTKSARRKLRRRAKREARHATHTNHKISKEIVADAQRTGRGIAVEDLAGIRDRVRLWPSQRATLSSWPFHQLGEFLACKARRVGVPYTAVDPAYTSQTCPVPWCRHTCRGNRPRRDVFSCRSCGFAGPADHIAALNVARRAGTAWAFVDTPNDPAVESGVSASRACHPDRRERRKPEAASALGR